MSGDDEQKLILEYSNLMIVIRQRLLAVGKLRSHIDPKDDEFSVVLGESIYLQYRKICELIAIACLVAHSDFDEARRLEHEYSADMIMKRMEKLEDFYPQAIRPAEGHTPERPVLQYLKSEEFLTRTGLKDLYAETHERLHQKSLKNIRRNHITRLELDRMHDWYLKIGALIRSHQIRLLHSRVLMADVPKSGVPRLLIGKFDGLLPKGSAV